MMFLFLLCLILVGKNWRELGGGPMSFRRAIDFLMKINNRNDLFIMID